LNKATPIVRVESPFPEYSLPALWKWTYSFRHRTMDDYSPQTESEFVEAFQRNSENGVETFGVYRDDELGGFVSIERLSPVLATSHVVFKPNFFGRATTDRSLIEIYGAVFASGVKKIASRVFADNTGIIALGVRLGAKVEGRFRAHTMRGGNLVDMAEIGLRAEDLTQWDS